MNGESKPKIDPISFITKNSVLKKYISVFLALAILNLVSGCSYYKVKPLKLESNEQMATHIRDFNNAEKYFVLHANGYSYQLINPLVIEETLELSGTVQNLTSPHLHKEYQESGRTYRYKDYNTPVLDEIHLYLSDETKLILNEKVFLPISEINEIAYNKMNFGRTIADATLTTIGSFVVIMLIVAALKSSCPFVYVKDGDNYVFSGELYPGNIIKNAQQTDFLKLPDISLDNTTFTLQITNELLEVQHTDLAQLIVVDHPKNTQAYNTSGGEIYLATNPIAPIEVIVDGQTSGLNPVLKTDGDKYLFDSKINTTDSKRAVVLKFNKSKEQKKANLLLTLKNSMWLDYVWGKFNSKFGMYYPEFQKKQQEATALETKAWIRSQHIPLTVSVKINGEWQVVNEIQSVGPLQNREVLIPLDLVEPYQEIVEVKLETGFMFWELDYAAIDFSNYSTVKQQVLSPVNAITQDGKDVNELLSELDDNYFTQENLGDLVTLTYEMPDTRENSKRTVFFKNKGYYTYIRDYSGIPDFQSLLKFRKPEAFTKFSENEYHNMIAPFTKGNDFYTSTNEK
jgi:hypothetical protein